MRYRYKGKNAEIYFSDLSCMSRIRIFEKIFIEDQKNFVKVGTKSIICHKLGLIIFFD